MKRTNIDFTARFGKVEQVNPEFSIGTCGVMALGKNRNMSHISRDSANAAEGSLWNIPIVGHIYKTEDGKLYMGGHDMEFTKDEDGNYHFEVLTVPFGVVPERPDSLRYVDIEEPKNRGVHTYMEVPIILWTGRYPELMEAASDIGDGIVFNESMEIAVHKYEQLADDPNYVDITDYTYSALCLLGRYKDEDKSVEPCFPCSNIRLNDYEFDNTFSDLFSELKKELSEVFGENTEKGGLKVENEIIEPVCADDTAPATENFASAESTDVVENAVPEVDNEESSDNAQAAEDYAVNEVVTFGATYRKKRKACCEMLQSELVYDASGRVIQETYYDVCDFDDKYVYGEKWIFNAEGSRNEFFRVAYSYDDKSETAAVAGPVEKMLVEWLTEDEYTALQQMRTQYGLLVEYKANREEADRRAICDAVMTEFVDLDGNDEFEAVREHRYDYESADALRNACYIIRGKFSVPVSAHKTTKETVVPVATVVERVALTARDRMHEKYGKK